MGEATVYCVMHMEKCVAQVSTAGECKIYLEDFMPCDLVLAESDDFDDRINNVINFYSWCASRLIPHDRTYAKEILNSIGASQSVTDRERAQIALSYHCLSLLDVFWVKGEKENIRFEDINLYTHSLSNALVDIALRGYQMTVTNAHLLANDLSTGGCYPKAWVRREDGQMHISWQMICPLVDVILKRGCAERMASIFIKMADRMQSSAKCWQVKSVDALTAIRFCMSRGCLRTSRFPSAES